MCARVCLTTRYNNIPLYYFCETLTWLQYRNIDIREAIYIKKMKHRYIKKENGKSSNWCLST